MESLKELFLLDPEVRFFNHGSFGATPRPVFESYQRWQRELERQPVAFLGVRHDALLLEARTALADYVGTSADNVVFVPNATTGFNIVARSLHLQPGDEVLSSNHEYGAMERTWRFLSEQRGFSYVPREIPVPVTDAGRFVDEFWAGVTPRTRVISLSHVTSPTALTFPIEPICRKAREAGILTLIDGAHAPGQIDIDLDSLGADFYTGNLHKWVCAPKGSGFLYAAPKVQDLVEPLIVSFGWDAANTGPTRFAKLLQWAGTRDIAPFLAVPDAIRFMADHDWPVVRARCHELCVRARRALSEASGVPSISPDTTEWFSQMGVASLPPQTDMAALGRVLLEEHNIVVPLITWGDRRLVRISVQAYNTEDDVNTLIDTIVDFIGRR